jgi:hypothetical protein
MTSAGNRFVLIAREGNATDRQNSGDGKCDESIHLGSPTSIFDKLLSTTAQCRH